MRNILLAVFISLFGATTAFAEPETKKVCVEQQDAKTGKTKEVCKTVKVYKKLEFTEVSDNK